MPDLDNRPICPIGLERYPEGETHCVDHEVKLVVVAEYYEKMREMQREHQRKAGRPMQGPTGDTQTF